MRLFSTKIWLLYRTFDSDLSFCRVVVCRSSCGGSCCGPPTAFPVRAPVCRGCPCWDPPVCHRVQGDSVAKRQALMCVFVGVVGKVRSCALHSCSWSYITLVCNWEHLHSCSTGSAILSPSYHFFQIFGGLWVLSPTRHLVRHVLHLVRDRLVNLHE